MSANFVGNTLTQREAIETYTPYDVTSSRPRKTIIAFFANFGGIEKLFCAPEQSLNSKIMPESVQHILQFSGIKRGAKISFHRHFKLWSGAQNNFSIPPKLAKNAIVVFRGLELVTS